MAKGFMPVSARSLSEERRMRALVKSITITKHSIKKIESLYEEYRDVCKKIRVVAGKRKFKGTYTEVLNLYKESAEGISPELDKLLNMWRVIDAAVKVEAAKLGYTGDKWLRECWKGEA